jgi:D-alanyl-D-alanine carboxypeptidase
MIMPNQPPDRDRAGRAPHARPIGPAPARDPRGSGASGALRSPAGIGIAAVALVAVFLALSAMFTMPNGSPASIAAAGGSLAPSATPSGSAGASVAATAPEPSASASAEPTVAPSGAPPAPSLAPTDAPPHGTPVANATANRLQRTVDTFRSQTGIPGISVAVVWDDGRAWAGASGTSDVAADRPMTTGTAFAFASVSKTFTAAVVLQLVDEGKVVLDAPAAKYLPAYGLDRRITVRMLMDHRSSLPDFFSNVKIDRALQVDKGATWTAARTWRYVPRWRPTPGSVYDYSNTNYLLLGQLVEQVTGNPLATEVRNRLFDPLGLETAWYQAVEKPKAPGTLGYRLTRTATGSVVKPVARRSGVMPFRSVVTAAAGAGSIAGTATDAARWMQAYGSGRLLSSRTFHEMIRDSAYTKAMHARVTYGLGVQVITIEKQRTLGHSGRYLGFQNTVRYLRGPGISIAVLTNQNTWDPAVLMRRLIRIVAPVKPAG